MTPTADFETLWDNHHDAVYAFVCKHAPRALVDDLMQDVWLRVWSALLRGCGWHSNARAWLYRIARNLIVDTYRARHEWPVELDARFIDRTEDGDFNYTAGDVLPDPAMDVHEVVTRHLACETVRRAAERLTLDQEQVLTLRLEGYAMEEIAPMIGKEYHATKALDYRARQSIAPRLRAMWGEAA